MNKLIFSFFILFHFCLYSQNGPISKRQLLKAFKKSIEQKDRKWINTDSNPWVTNNADSLFYKSDTIVFTNAKNLKREYCRVINWSFYKKNEFVLSDSNSCREPSRARVNQPGDWFRIEIFESDRGLFFDIYNFETLIDRFKVISFYFKNQESVLKLTRLKS